MNLRGSNVGERETIVTLIACVLLGLEVVPGLQSSLSILLGLGLLPSSPLYTVLGLVFGGVLGAFLGVVLLGQGGVRIPPPVRRGGRSLVS